MAKLDLAIIIPAYNVSDTLTRCVESIISQDYQSWLTIIVDDGSTDKTPEIADVLSHRDNRIITIHKENGGLSDARNQGIEIALKHEASYITFVDSDDYLADNTIAPLMSLLADHPEYDMLEYSATIHGDSKRKNELLLSNTTYTIARDYWLKGEAYNHTYSWNKIIRAKVFSSGVRFPFGKIFEDVWTLPDIIRQCNIIATTSLGKYIYVDNPNGISHAANNNINQMRQLLEGQLYAIHSLNIDIKNEKFNNLTARLYLTLRNQQTTLCRLNHHFPKLLPHRCIPLSAGRNIRERIKIILYNIHFPYFF